MEGVPGHGREGGELDELESPFQSKPFYDSMFQLPTTLKVVRNIKKS